MRVVVVGAGIVGLAIAHGLIDEGHEVAILDKGEPGGATSRGNAACIAHTDIMPMATPGLIWKVAGWLLDPLGPLAIRPAHLPALAPFLVRFALAGMPGAVERSVQGLVPLQALSMPAWQRRLGALGLEAELNHKGFLYVFDDVRAYAAATPVHRRQRDLGITVEALESPAAIKALEPALADRFVRAVNYPAVAHVSDPFALSSKLAAALRQRGGRLAEAEVARVTIAADGAPTVHQRDGMRIEADAIVIAAGVWSRVIAAGLGDRIPLETERGYNATMTAPGVSVDRPILFEGHGFVVSPLSVGLRVGGAVELASVEAAPNWRRVEALLAKAKTFLPGLAEGGRQDWMGCRPALPDSLPVISHATASRRVIYAFGHGHHGLTQAAATAEQVAAMIAGRTPPLEPTAYRAQRF
jgi:D-amino-acid dehydrogenase